MSDSLPLVPLGEVLRERQEIPSENALVKGEIRIIEKIGFNDGQIRFRNDPQTKTGMILIRPGDLVVSGINAAKGAIAIHGEENNFSIAATIHYSSYIPDKSKVDIRYLWWLLRSHTFRDLLQNYVPGGIKTELKAKRLLPIPVPLPRPDEQRRIVTLIEKLDAKIEEARKLRRRAVEEEGALLKSAYRKLIGDQPSDEWIPLNTYVEEIENGWSPQCENRPAGVDEWGVLKVGSVSFGFFNQNENKALPDALEPRRNCEVKPGDFLMSRANTLELVGACAIVNNTRPTLMLSDKIFRFIFKKDTAMEHSFLDHVLKSPALRMQIQKVSTGTSPTMKNISKEKVLNLLIPQKDIQNQKRIALILNDLQNKINALKRTQAMTTAELDVVWLSILDRAFKGEL